MNTRRKNDPYPRPAASRSTPSTEDLHRRTAEKAYELFLRRGCAPGRELDDWLEAEHLVRQELAPQARRAPLRPRAPHTS